MAIVLSGSLILSGSLEATGGVTISGSIASASFATTSSYSLNALTSSNAMTASSADTLYVRNNVTALGSITAQTLIVQTVTSSVLFTTGSNIIGSSLSNVQQLTGSVGITGSLAINGTTAVVGSGTANYVPKFTASGTIGNSAITDDGTTVTLVSRALSGTSATFSGDLTGGVVYASDSNGGVSFLNSSITTNNAYIRLVGSAHGFIAGREGSAGGQIFTGASAYASVVGSEATDPLQFATNNTVVMTIASGGNVGIGTSSPTTLLHLSSTYNGGGTGQMHMTSNGTEGGTITFEKTSGTAQKYKLGLGTTSLFIYNETAGNQPFTLTSGGNVLIGTTTDNGNKLNVNGSIYSNSTITGGTGNFSTVNASNFKSFSGTITLASGATGTIYTMDTMGLYTVQAAYVGANANFCASGIFFAQSYSGDYYKLTTLFDGANIDLSQSGAAIRVRNDGYGTYAFEWTILFQPGRA